MNYYLISLTIFGLFTICAIVQLVFWLGIFPRILFHKNANSSISNKSVSVIICARNEYENLKKYLPRILSQNYRSFEVIVVNHNSADKTSNLLLQLKEEYPYLRIVNYNNSFTNLHGKKGPLTKGIEAAKNDILLLTDADCKPLTKNWVQLIQQQILLEKRLVLGYSPYRKEKGLLNMLIRYETIYTAIQYFSFALMGIPYMGVGRNLCYSKQLFNKADGFNNHGNISSGDDDLFVSAIANASNTTICLNPDTFVESEPQQTWKGFWQQKQRHYSTASHYQWYHKLGLGILSFSLIGFYAFGLLNLLFHPIYTVTITMIRTLLGYLIYWLISDKLKDTNTKYFYPFLEMLFVLHLIIHVPSLFTGKIKKWK